jgi:hypothetical protein
MVLLSIFSRVDRQVGRLVYDQYGRIIVAHGNAALRFLRRRWWGGLIASLLISGIGAGASYVFVDRQYGDLRNRGLSLRSTVDAVADPVTLQLRRVSDRLIQLEQAQKIESEDIKELKKRIEDLHAVSTK